MYRDKDNLYHTDHITTRLLSGTGGDYQDTRGPAYRLRTVSRAVPVSVTEHILGSLLPITGQQTVLCLPENRVRGPCHF